MAALAYGDGSDRSSEEEDEDERRSISSGDGRVHQPSVRRVRRRIERDSSNGGGEEGDSRSSVSRSPVRLHLEKEKRIRELMAAPTISVSTHGGLVVQELRDGAQLIVPPRIDMARNAGGANRFGEVYEISLGKPRVPSAERSSDRKREAELLMLQRIREVEHMPQIDVSRLAVKLGLLDRGMSGSDIEELYQNGQRCEGLPMLPPFKAFTGPVRKELLFGVDALTSRPIPQAFLSMGYASSREALTMPCVDGLEELKITRQSRTGPTLVQNVRMFNVRSTFVSKMQTLWVCLSAMDVHVFNTLHNDLVELSGVSHMIKRSLPPFSRLFDYRSLVGHNGVVPFPEASCSQWASAALESDDELGAYSDFVQTVAGIELPSRDKFFMADRWNPKRSPELPDSVLTEFLRYSPVTTVALQHLPAAGKLKDRALAFLRGYLDWRYFCLPDLVAGCLALNYEIAHPEVDETFIIACPSDERERGASNMRKVCRGMSVADPSSLVLFSSFGRNYDEYAATMMLYNMICSKKSFALSRRAERDSDRAFYRRYRLEIIPAKVAKHVAEVRARVSGRACDSTTLFAELSEEVKTSCYNAVYRWRRYTNLCCRKETKQYVLTDQDGKPGASESATVRALMALEGIVPKVVYAPPPTETVEFEDAREHSLAVQKAAMRETAVAILPRSRVAHDQALTRALDGALAIWEASFTLVKPKRIQTIGKGAYKFFYTTGKAVKCIILYMQAHDMISKTVPSNTVRAFITAERSVAPQLVRYFNISQSIKWQLNPNCPLSLWLGKRAVGLLPSPFAQPATTGKRKKVDEEGTCDVSA